MEAVNRTGDIEAGCDLPFERRWWCIQRICWGIMFLLLLGGVAGLFGGGPLSKATTAPPGSALHVHYERLARRETPAILELHLDKQAIASGRFRIRLNNEFVNRLRIKQIIPEPLSTEPLADGARFTFQTDPALDSATIVFIQDPSTPGIVEGEVAVEGAAPVQIRQFVFP
jgi:hypothetical protein